MNAYFATFKYKICHGRHNTLILLLLEPYNSTPVNMYVVINS